MLGQQQENQARLKNAEGDLERYQKLVAEGLITKQQVTTQEALVQQYGGALQANDAQVANARLQLAYTKITAPISGRLGLRQVDAGNLIRGGDANGLVVITQMRPISVIFTVPEAELPAVLDAYRRGKRPQVEAWDRSEASMLATGTLQTIDNQIDTTTGTIKLRAQFANTDEKLFPNQFVNMRLRVQTRARRDGHPGGGRAARLLRHVRLRRETRQHRDHPAHRPRSRPGRARVHHQGAHAGRAGRARGR